MPGKRRATKRRRHHTTDPIVVPAGVDVWLNARQAGAYAGFSDEHIKKMAIAGALKGYRVRGVGAGARLIWRFRKPDLDRFLETGGMRGVA